MAVKSKIGSKYFFWRWLPDMRPKSRLGRLARPLGLVPKELMRERELYLIDQFNKHIFETVLADRKMMLERLVKDRGEMHSDLNERITQLKEENEKLGQEYERAQANIKKKQEEAETEKERYSRAARKKEEEKSEASKLKSELKRREAEISDLKNQLKERREFPGIVEASGLPQDDIDILVGRGYELLSDFPGQDGRKREHYVLQKGTESRHHAALRFAVFEELKKERLKPSTEFGSRASVEYLTRREGKSVGVEVLDGPELKDLEPLRQRVESLKRQYGIVMAVSLQEDVSPYQGLGIQVVPFKDFRRSLKR